MKRYIAIALAAISLCSACELIPKEDDTPKPDMSRKFTSVTLDSIYTEQVATTFSGKLYLDKNGTIPTGTITNGTISIELPALSDSQCRSMTNVNPGLSFNPNTGFYQNDWIYVKSNDTTDTIIYRLTGNIGSTGMVKFIYSSIPSTFTGTFSGTNDPNNYTYNCALSTGWNICKWSATGNNVSCTKTTTETDFGSVTTWFLAKN